MITSFVLYPCSAFNSCTALSEQVEVLATWSWMANATFKSTEEFMGMKVDVWTYQVCEYCVAFLPPQACKYRGRTWITWLQRHQTHMASHRQQVDRKEVVMIQIWCWSVWTMSCTVHPRLSKLDYPTLWLSRHLDCPNAKFTSHTHIYESHVGHGDCKSLIAKWHFPIVKATRSAEKYWLSKRSWIFASSWLQTDPIRSAT